MEITIKSVPTPKFSFSDESINIAANEYERRLKMLYSASKADWVVTYADREHYGNLTFLINFDPRFEEAIFVLGPSGIRTLIVGNEGLGYTSVIPVKIDIVLCQSLSLCGQQRNLAPSLKEILKNIGIKSGQTVSVIGWKYLEIYESDDYLYPAFVPTFLTETLRKLVANNGEVRDGTILMMHPEYGLRVNNSADQIANFEVAAQNSSNSVFGIIQNIKPGMSEFDAARLMNYPGGPMSMHPILTSGKKNINGLRSPSSRIIELGDAISTAVGYWGSLVCRAGIVEDKIEQSFLNSTVAPYFNALATWYQTMQIGIQGADVYNKVASAFKNTGLQSLLNPGHLTSYDEWLHSPIRPNSTDKIKSGMVFQCDIIPTPMKDGELINCEDTIAIADINLRADIQSNYPDLWNRIHRRRKLMIEQLGIDLHDEILPLTEGTAYLPPFWLIPDMVCSVNR